MKVYLVILGLCASLSLMSQSSFLSEFQWKNRIVLIESKSLVHELVTKQISTLLSDTLGIQDRDILILILVGDQLYDDALTPLFPVSIDQEKTKDSFAVSLIGKDGGTKLHDTDIVSNKALYNLIDRMPMRQAEIRAKRKN